LLGDKPSGASFVVTVALVWCSRPKIDDFRAFRENRALDEMLERCEKMSHL